MSRFNRKKLLPYRIYDTMAPVLMAQYECANLDELRKKFEAEKNRRLVIIDTQRKKQRLLRFTSTCYWVFMMLYAPIYVAVVVAKVVIYFTLAVLALLSFDVDRFKRMMRHLTHTNPFSHGY